MPSTYKRHPVQSLSPTPPATSSVRRAIRGPTPTPCTPVAQITRTIPSVGPHSVEGTISSHNQSERSTSLGLTHRRPAEPFISPSRGEIRPSITRRPASDPRHNRPSIILEQSHSSPTRRARRRLDRSLISKNENSQTTLEQTQLPQSVPSFSNLDSNHFDAPMITAQNVHDELRVKLCKAVTPNSKTGSVYIVRDPTQPHLLKIGASINSSQRQKGLERGCDLRLETIFVSNELEHYIRAEHLVHANLLHLRRKNICIACGRNHQEWYEVSEEEAIRTVEMWTRFIQQEQPYNAMGKLKSIWIFLMHKRRHVGEVLDHEGLTDLWTNIRRSPSMVDYAEQALTFLKKHPIWCLLWAHPWQVFSIFSWIITSFTSRTCFSLYLSLGVLLAVLVCTCFSASGKSKRV
ncbi:hypothetical protein K504DRAFT_506085 [Pleomassaria siparia CBS 279.74]|uniref:Bacteriophage T5 Orf172 DNA-binding domain-containing protein n=1 Tax=Pleomassaria siparia CBS 279.74 TaxID=1314801 RepID=A0A6G1JZB8_9PLEO|nr:hypothetical protein K504DRAFT_506085 [Pleomassaria siparia CBS 279.74]